MLKMRLDIWAGDEFIIDMNKTVRKVSKYLVHEALESKPAFCSPKGIFSHSKCLGVETLKPFADRTSGYSAIMSQNSDGVESSAA